MLMSTAEKIETIVQCRLSGNLGTFTEYAQGKFRVEADGLTVLVRCGAHGWHVSFKSFEGIDPELYVAAMMALEAGGRANVTRHANLGADIGAWL